MLESSASMTEPRLAGVWKAVTAGFAAFIVATVLMVPPADAAIVPQKSIAGVRLFMKKPEVLARLGRPDGRVVLKNPFTEGRFLRLRFGRTRVLFSGTTRSSIVYSVETRDRRQRTRKGTGVGSTRAKLRQAHPAIRCESLSGLSSCYFGKFLPFKTVTVFYLGKKPGLPARVERVSLGYVLD